LTITSTSHAPPAALSVVDLAVRVGGPASTVEGVSDASFSLIEGATLGLVGESGSGKSLTVRTLLGLLPPSVQISRGHVCYFGQRLTEARDIQRHCGVVLQEALSALNPTRTAGDVIADGVQVSRGATRGAARTRALELMGEVGISDPERRYASYPHELSGGLRQRVMIAAALSTDPQILICDEPTTALDVTIQRQVIDLLARLVRSRHMTLLFVSHDLGVVDLLCEQIAVMYAGQIVELGPTAEVLGRPTHPYTQALLDATLPITHRVAQLRPIEGQVPNPINSIKGCRFAPRCHYAQPQCTAASYGLARSGSDEQRSACIRADELTTAGLL
jgi:oligopeptide/dipeptide ABC transporter ATP-binding protein